MLVFQVVFEIMLIIFVHVYVVRTIPIGMVLEYVLMSHNFLIRGID